MTKSCSSSRWRLWVAACLMVACGLNAPSLQLGLFGDDYAHRRFLLDHLSGVPSHVAFWNMFDWRAIDRDTLDPSSLFGRLPWWAGADFSFALLRPLSTCSHYLDYLMWPDSAWAMHLHNIVLLGGLIFLASRLYLQLFGPGLAAWLALALFAIDDAHTISTAWIASRNTLLTASCVLLTLAAHRKVTRAQPSKWFALTTILALLAAHASSEGGIVAWAYLVAYTLFLDSRGGSARVRSLLPLAALSLGWMLGSAALGYGVHGSGVYLDPRYDPVGFVKGVQQRFPGLLELQFGIPPEFSQLLPVSMQPFVTVASRLYMTLLGIASVLLWRRSPALRFCVLASAAALIPQCAAGSFARLLPLSGFAAHGVSAVILQELLASARARRGRWPAVVLFATLSMAIHVGVAVVIPTHARAFSKWVHDSVLRAAHSLPQLSSESDGRIVVLNFPDYLRSVFVDLYRRELFGAGPSRMDVLGISPAPVRLTRSSEEAIDLEPVVGFLYEPTSLLVRQPQHHFLMGQRFELDGLQVEVIGVTQEGLPARIRVHHVERTDARWFRWSWQTQRFVQVTLPYVGGSAWLDSGAFDTPQASVEH